MSQGVKMGGWVTDQMILKEKVTSILRKTYSLINFPPENLDLLTQNSENKLKSNWLGS